MNRLIVALLLLLPACRRHREPLPAAAVVANLDAGIKANSTDIDVLGDGSAHFKRTFAGGKVATEELIVNGVRKSFTLHDGGTTIQTDYRNGRPSRVVRTTPTQSSPPGQVVEITEYASNPADPDVRTSYTAEASSPTVTILREEDPNHDGNFSQTGSTVQDRVDEEFSFGGTGSSCSPAQRDELRKAARDMAEKAHECLVNLDPDLALAFDTYLASHDFTVSCGGSDRNRCGTHDYDGSIRIFDAAFTDPLCAPDATLFHEVLHEPRLLGKHSVRNEGNNPEQDKADRIWACSRTCFGRTTKSRLTCQVCLGTKVHEPRCDRYDPEPCPYYCSCLDTYYTDATKSACLQDCTGLRCAFGNVCGPATQICD